MITKIYPPHPRLSPYIDIFLYCKMSELEMDLMPRGSNQLFFILNDDHVATDLDTNNSYNSRFFISSPATRHYKMLCNSPLESVGVIFKPFGAYRLLGVPHHLIKDNFLEFKSVFSNEVNDIFNKMEDQSENPEKIIHLLQTWLLEQLDKLNNISTNKIANACSILKDLPVNISIGEIAKKIAIPKRTLEHIFREQVGISPKTFHRICRFTKIQELFSYNDTHDWQELVYNFGYFDQTHFIKEFKKFSGYTPTQFHFRKPDLADFDI